MDLTQNMQKSLRLMKLQTCSFYLSEHMISQSKKMSGRQSTTKSSTHCIYSNKMMLRSSVKEIPCLQKRNVQIWRTLSLHITMKSMICWKKSNEYNKESAQKVDNERR